MEDNIRQFGDELGRKALARDWDEVRSLLAPWLRVTLSVDDVRAFFEDAYRKMLDEWGVEGDHYPEYPDPEIGGNNYLNATGLREPISWAGGRSRPVPPEVTDDNMRYWMSMQLQCSDEQMAEFESDYFAEVWMAIVETSEGLRVGYWSQGGYL